MAAPKQLGMNFGAKYLFGGSVPTAEVNAELDRILALGINKIRVNIRGYLAPSQQIANMMTVAQLCKIRGFYVVSGITASAAQLDSSNTSFTDYTNAAVSRAVQMQAYIDEFQVGNELEGAQVSGTTNAQIRDLVRSVAQAVKSSTFAGKISYSVSNNLIYINEWAGDSSGIGAMDWLGLNVYGLNQSDLSGVIARYRSLTNVYTNQRVKITELNLDSSWSGYTSSPSHQYLNIKDRINSLISIGASDIYFFTWDDANTGVGSSLPTNYFACKKDDGTYRVWVAAIAGERPWFDRQRYGITLSRTI